MKTIIKQFNKKKQIAIINEYLISLDYKKPIEVDIKPLHKKRSTDQNSVYWTWLKIICIEQDGDKNPTKLDIEIKHETFKELLLDPIGESKTGRKIYSTKHLKTIEFNEYMEKIRMTVVDFLGLSLFYPSDGELYDQMLSEFGL